MYPLLCAVDAAALRHHGRASAGSCRSDAEGWAATRDLWLDTSSEMEVRAVWARWDSTLDAVVRSVVTRLTMVQPTGGITGVVTNARDAAELLAKTDTTLVEPTRSSWAQALDRFAIEYTPMA